MPLCSLHLISLDHQTPLPKFLRQLQAWNIRPISVAHVVRWIIIPEKIDTADLLEPVQPYSLMVILPGTKPFPGVLEASFSAHYTLQIGIPSRLLDNFPEQNQALLHPPSPDRIPQLTGSLDRPIVDPRSSQTLTLSPELQTWISDFARTHTGQNAMSMLNLLSFHPDKKESYLHYGRTFASTIGSKRGGNAKLVGHVVYPDNDNNNKASPSTSVSRSDLSKWDEFALAHYPSIMHFADMLASKDYQEVNQKYRVPALKDTCILCTSEIEVEEIMRREEEQESQQGNGDNRHEKAKL